MSRPLPFYDGTSDFSLLFYNILNVYFCNILEFVYDLTISYSHIVRVFRIILPHNPVFLFYCPLVYWDFLGLRMWNKLRAFLQIHNTFICTPQVQCFEPNICSWTLRKSYPYKGDTVELWFMYDISLAVAILYSLMSSSVDTIRKV